MLREDEKWFAVSLRFIGLGFDPQMIEDRIKLSPRTLRVLGEKWVGKTGIEYGPSKQNIWSYREELPSSTSFEVQICSLLSRIEPYTEFISTLAKTKGVNAEIFCGFSSGNGQGGDILSAETLLRIAKLGLSLSLDLYPPDTSGVADA